MKACHLIFNSEIFNSDRNVDKIANSESLQKFFISVNEKYASS